MQADSVSKIIERYLATVTKQTFVYDSKFYVPRPLKVSPLLLRGYTCPPSCSGCCFKFTLDYLPSDPRPPEAVKRFIEFNGKKVLVYTDAQEENTTNKCKHVIPVTGRCGIYERRPFTCDFELIRSLSFSDEERPNVLTQKLFGRGWSYQRIDGGKGALCEMLPRSDEAIAEVVRKLERLKAWSDHFGIATWIPELLQIIRAGQLIRPVVFSLTKQEGFGL